MPVSSNIASEIFSAVWNLVLIGALRRSEKIAAPFDDEWRQQGQRRHDEIMRIRNTLRSIGQFTPEIADMLITDTPWRGQVDGSYLATDEVIRAELAMMIGARPNSIDLGAGFVAALNLAVRRQLAQLLNGLLAAAFEIKQDPVPDLQMQSILLAAAALAEEPAPRAAIADAAHDWRIVFLPRFTRSAGFEGWSTYTLDRLRRL